MKRLIIAALVTAGLSSAAIASHVHPTGPYETRGECERALKHARNDVRKNNNHGFSPSEINQQYRTQLACEQDPDDDLWYVVIL